MQIDVRVNDGITVRIGNDRTGKRKSVQVRTQQDKHSYPVIHANDGR